LTRLLVAAWLVAAPAVAAAHEIGTTQVSVTVHRDHTWSAAITTGPQSLVNKLEAAAGRPLSRDLDGVALRAALEQRGPAIAAAIDFRADGVRSPARVAVAALVLPADVTQPSYVEIVAEGAVAPAAIHVTWQYGLSYSTYPLKYSASTNAGEPLTLWLDADASSPPLEADSAAPPLTRAGVIRQYAALGFVHILPRGFDHVLFILGIFLLTPRLKPLLFQVTAFTIAHSVTLGLAMYGIVSLPPRVVEPLIAVSIAYVAVENVVTADVHAWRPALVFAFGLLHGMGFAGVLRNLRLPRGEFIPALVSFNVGIEAAQLSLIAAAFLSVSVWYRHKPWYRARVVIPASVAIAATGVFWILQRVAAG